MPIGQIANRMQTFSVKDLDHMESFKAFKKLREETIGKENVELDEILAEAAEVAGASTEIWQWAVMPTFLSIGGRLAYLSRLARSVDIKQAIERLKDGEKAWLLTNTGLIPDCDDDVMDEVSIYVITLAMVFMHPHL